MLKKYYISIAILLFLILSINISGCSQGKDATQLNNDGMALYHQGKYDEAIKMFDKAIEVNPKDPYPWHNKGLALEKQGKKGEAEKCYARAAEIDPAYADALKEAQKQMQQQMQGELNKSLENIKIE